MNTIYNYIIQPLPISHKEFSFSVSLTKWRWLEKPVKWFLQKLGAYVLSYTSTIQRVALDTKKTYERIQSIKLDQRKRGLREPKCVILGYNQYKDLLDSPLILSHSLHLGQDSFYGLQIILNPEIDGVVVLDFAP